MSGYTGRQLLFRLKCAEAKNSAFQSFFEHVMSLHDMTFLPVKPSGAEGDWKCDGYSAATHTVYQCYSPDELRAGKTSRKIREDFSGAKDKWGAKMSRWVFVWNGSGLPPQVVTVLLELGEECEGQVAVEHLGPQRLWDDVVSHLSDSVLDELLGAVSASPDGNALLRSAAEALGRDDGELCRDICARVLSMEESASAEEHLEAHILLASDALHEDDIGAARGNLDLAGQCLRSTTHPSLRAQFCRLEALLLHRDGRHSEAEAAFLRGLNVQSAVAAEAEVDAPLEEVQCVVRADLVLCLAEVGEGSRALEHADAAEAYLQSHLQAQGGQLLLHVVDALVSLFACIGEGERAQHVLELLEEQCRTEALASEGARLLHRLTGRAGHVGATDVAMACCDLSSRLALRADLTEDFWAAQYNAAGVCLQRGDMNGAQERLQTLWPLLDSDGVPEQIKSASLLLASELAAEQGDPLAALELQQKALRHVGDEPINVAVFTFKLGHRLKSVGRVVEACESFGTASSIAERAGAPGKLLFDVIAPWCESEMLLGHWQKAEELLGRLESLPRPEHFVDDICGRIRSQLEGSREIRHRVERIKQTPLTSAASTLLEANALAMLPLLNLWKESDARGSDEAASSEEASLLYDYWGSGGAAEVMANLHRHAPDHFSPFVEVRSVEDVRRAIRMFSLFSDTLVLLWKGALETKKVLLSVPWDGVKGGCGYIHALGDVVFESPSSGPWFPALGQGAYLPSEVGTFLSKEAASLIAQGRLLVLPAPAVGCWQANHGPCENLVAELMGASPVFGRSTNPSPFPVAIVPFFEDAPLEAIADLLGEYPEHTRRLRLALLRKSRELREHGSPDGASRELRDEITEAFSEWRGMSQQMARKHEWHNGEDELAAESLSFQGQWAPIFTLSRLGYRWSIGTVGQSYDWAAEYHVEIGTPYGNWLVPAYEGKLVAAVRQTPGEGGDEPARE